MKIISIFTFKATEYFSTTIFLQFQNQGNSPFAENFICKSKTRGKVKKKKVKKLSKLI